MRFDYLDFEISDDGSGNHSFDAMASVLPDRLHALFAEIEDVLTWAIDVFGPPSPGGADESWDFDLHAVGEPDTALKIDYDSALRRVAMPTPWSGRVTVTLTISGSSTFAHAMREQFE